MVVRRGVFFLLFFFVVLLITMGNREKNKPGYYLYYIISENFLSNESNKMRFINMFLKTFIGRGLMLLH